MPYQPETTARSGYPCSTGKSSPFICQASSTSGRRAFSSGRLRANETTPGDVKNANQLDLLRVTVTLPFRNVRWVALDYFTSYDTTLTAQAYWYSLRDKEYPSPGDPPIE